MHGPVSVVSTSRQSVSELLAVFVHVWTRTKLPVLTLRLLCLMAERPAVTHSVPRPSLTTNGALPAFMKTHWVSDFSQASSGRLFSSSHPSSRQTHTRTVQLAILSLSTSPFRLTTGHRASLVKARDGALRYLSIKYRLPL
jgi:hypothetical protein